tara:strand:+ start:1614 stop:2042 length:429 start_codon:yes stop_codon:yes gene_type:complete
MKNLFENWRQYLNEVNPAAQEMRDRIAAHQGVEPTPARSGQDIANELDRGSVEKAIQDFSFNSAQSSQHRWSPRQPIVDYYFDESDGNWKFQAAFPDGTNNADNWLRLPPKGWSSENIEVFLTQVKEFPHQLSLGIENETPI